jgi:hypothetical protein
MKEKTLDAVKMMRDIREKLHETYKNHPGQKQKDLAKLREKYRHLLKKPASV